MLLGYRWSYMSILNNLYGKLDLGLIGDIYFVRMVDMCCYKVVSPRHHMCTQQQAQCSTLSLLKYYSILLDFPCTVANGFSIVKAELNLQTSY